MDYQRYIFIGDPHGCYEELKELISLVSYVKGRDRVIIVGDLVDRGPDSAGVVKYCRQNEFESVRGNHEEKHLRHRRNLLKTGKSKVQLSDNARTLHDNLDEDDWNYLAGFPSRLRLTEKLVVVHAGLRRGIPVEDQDENTLVRMRYAFREDGKMASMKKKGDTFLHPSTAGYWTELWDGPDSVIYGHQPQMMGPAVDENFPGVFCYGIDTGCCFGRQLTAAVFADLHQPPQFAQVNARDVYAQKFKDGVIEDEG